MKEYETTFILKPNTPEKDVGEVVDRLTKVVESHKGKILIQRPGALRKLSYLMDKQKEGLYLYFDYAAEPKVVEEFEKVLKLDERVLRFLTVLTREEVTIANRIKEIAEAQAQLEAAAAVAAAAPAATSAEIANF